MVCRAHVPGFRPRGDLALVGVDTTGRAAVVRVVPGQSYPCRRGVTEQWGKSGHRELDSNKWAAADLPAISVLRDITVLRRAGSRAERYRVLKNSINPLSLRQGYFGSSSLTSQLASALAFISRSTSAYTLVVSSDTWPSHARIVLMSTPERSRWVAVVWRMVCGLTRFWKRRSNMVAHPDTIEMLNN